MHQRWKASLPALLLPFHYLSTIIQPTVVIALESKLPRQKYFKPFRPLTSSLRSPSCLLTIKQNPGDSADSGSKVIDMILRVRSNLGTVKLTIEDELNATESTIRTAMIEEQQRKTGKMFKITQNLSFDPSGLHRINTSKSLKEQGIRHGSMVYCRLEEDISKDRVLMDNSDGVAQDKYEEEKKPGQSAEKKPSSNDVIDLMDSSDEEDTAVNKKPRGDLHDDDDVVVVISPPRSGNVHKKQSSDKKDSQVRKRKRLETNSASNHTKPKATMDASNIDSNPSNFQIASYNVWFGPPDPEAKDVFPKQRMAGIVKSLRAASIMKDLKEGIVSPLLFVGLQELTPPLVKYLTPHFDSIGYRICTQPIGSFGPSYGIGIAVPKDLAILDRQFVPYSNSIQGRGFLFIRTQTMLFATTHLESWCGPQFTGSKEREVQLADAAKFCRDQLNSVAGLELAVILGDLNWDDERKTKRSEPANQELLSLLPKGWKDAGTPFDYTYDQKENPMLSGNLRRRFDRCIYTTKQGKAFRSTGLQKIGKETIPNLVWDKKNPYNGTIRKMPVSPSDHFGIVISFSNAP